MPSPSPLLADPEIGPVDDLVDLDRYPIADTGGDAWRGVVDDVRRQLAATGLATLDGFLRPEALRSARAEVAAAVPWVPMRRQAGSVYHRSTDCTDPADPRNIELTWVAGHVTRDMLAPHTVGHRLYAADVFKRFVAACVGRDRVFEYADPIAGLVATILPPGGQYPWHYDTNEFVLTIMTQAPDEGGEFEYFHNLRRPGDENLPGLRRALDGAADDELRRITAQPGDLQLFLGRYSLHQVAPVAGATARHVLVLSYSDRPGCIGPVDRTRSVYGRVTEAHLLAEQVVTADSDGLIL